MDELIKITSAAVIPEKVSRLVAGDQNGAITSFTGTVRSSTDGREVSGLEFETYEPMALSEMKKIADQARDKWDLSEVAIHHRKGPVRIGEVAVVIAVSAPHRKNTFDACRYCIDRLKETVPIWKKEFFTDGEVWVSAHP